MSCRFSDALTLLYKRGTRPRPDLRTSKQRRVIVIGFGGWYARAGKVGHESSISRAPR